MKNKGKGKGAHKGKGREGKQTERRKLEPKNRGRNKVPISIPYLEEKKPLHMQSTF